MLTHLRYATLWIPAGTTVVKAADNQVMTTLWGRRARGRLPVDRQDRPRPDAEWLFTDGIYAYRMAQSAPGLVVTEEKFIKAKAGRRS